MPPDFKTLTCALTTLGCKVNQYETQAIRERLLGAGYREVGFREKADLYIINTCTVTGRAEEKSRKRIRRAARLNPEGTIVVTGCYAHAKPDTLRGIEGVTHVIPKNCAGRIIEILASNDQSPATGPRDSFSDTFDLSISQFARHARAFLKIEDGCDAFCSYCIVPHVRGPVRSRPLADVAAEARRLVANGHIEIVLTGIHLGVYGADLDMPDGLLRAAEALLAVDGLRRIRLSSVEVTEVSDALVELIASDDRLCPHFHIPLQSGDAGILRAMNRAYTPDEYLAALDRIRAKIPAPSFTSDVLVGFPGETDEQFHNTLEVCRQAGFSRMHAFPFSARPGTRAAGMSNQCPPQLIRERERQAMDIAEELALAYKQRFVGRVVEPLVETRRDHDTGKLCGYTARYLKTLLDGPDDLMNQIVQARVLSAEPQFLYAERCAR